jgi:hypothetical protein
MVTVATTPEFVPAVEFVRAADGVGLEGVSGAAAALVGEGADATGLASAVFGEAVSAPNAVPASKSAKATKQVARGEV